MSRLLLILMAVALATADETANKTGNQLVRNSRGVLSGDHSRLFGIVDAAVNAATSLTGLVGVGSKSSHGASQDTYELVEVTRPSDSQVGTGVHVSGQVSSSSAGSYQPCWPAKNPNQGPTVTKRVVGQNRRQLGDGPIHHPPVTVSRGRSPNTSGGSAVKTLGGPSMRVVRGPSVTVPRGPPVTVSRGQSVQASSQSSVTAPGGPPAQSGWKFAPSSLLSMAMPFKSKTPITNPIAPKPTSPPLNTQKIWIPTCPPPVTCPPPPPPQIEYVHIEHPPQIIEQVVEHHIEHPPQVIETVVEHHIEHPPQIIEQVVEHHIEHPPQVIETVVEHHIEHPPTIIEHTQHVVEKVPQVMVAQPVHHQKSKGKFF